MTVFTMRQVMLIAPIAFWLAAAGCNAATADEGNGNRAPAITITSPTPGASVDESTEVVFAGSAVDAEEGPLPDSLLRWSSSIDGQLGSGDTLRVTTLTPGRHAIRLQATDSAGATGQASVTLTVVGAGLQVGLDTIASGYDSPVYLTAPPNDTSRLFIVEQSGAIRILKNGVKVTTPFLDLTDSVSTGGEQGLLGLAFDPGYASNRRFYVSYTRSNGNSVLARYVATSGNPDVADPASGVTILGVTQPYSNHNGGGIAFGPDGYLYFGLGDGGSGGDPDGYGQNRTDLLGSILRLDVSGAGYTIPPTNPYAGHATYRKELWNYGLRNPWRWSFDRETGDLYIADVGQNAWEEIDVQPAASAGGENYGWRIMEGDHCYPIGTSCTSVGLVAPVLEYDHSDGCSVTGGYVYRGSDVTPLVGHYLYADYCSGWVRSFRWQGGQAVSRLDRPELDPGGNITSFGEDARGELYILTSNGRIQKIIAR